LRNGPRFFALYYRLAEYRGYFAPFLDAYLKDGMRLEESKLQEHRDLFLRVIGDVYKIFGRWAFRRYSKKNGAFESHVNRALYDVVMLSFAHLPPDQIRKKSRYYEALDRVGMDDAFNDAMRSSTSDKRHLQTRLDIWRKALAQEGVPIPYLVVGA
jgi:hypothetical protein